MSNIYTVFKGLSSDLSNCQEVVILASFVQRGVAFVNVIKGKSWLVLVIQRSSRMLNNQQVLLPFFQTLLH